MQYFQTLFAYNAWANDKIIQTLMSSDPPEPVRLMAHILGTEQLWLERLRAGDADSNLIWPDLDLAACSSKLNKLRTGWSAFLKETGEDFSRRVPYRNSTGTQLDNAIADILTHVINHSSYHRGQISMILRQQGEESVNTDYITYARSGTQR